MHSALLARSTLGQNNLNYLGRTEDLLLLLDNLRGDLMKRMTEGANDNIEILRRVKDQQDKRTQSEIACAAEISEISHRKIKQRHFNLKVLKGK